MSWYVTVLEDYAVFSGRARRKEYWMFVLFSFIFGFVAYLIGLGIGLGLGGGSLSAMFIPGVLSTLYALAVFVPGLAVSVRRLHDVGKSGWYLLINLIPIAGSIWFLVLVFTNSQPGDNKYGPNPKEEKEWHLHS